MNRDGRVALYVLEHVVEVLVDRNRDEGIPLAEVYSGLAVRPNSIPQTQRVGRRRTAELADALGAKLLKGLVQVGERRSGLHRRRAHRNEVPAQPHDVIVSATHAA